MKKSVAAKVTFTYAIDEAPIYAIEKNFFSFPCIKYISMGNTNHNLFISRKKLIIKEWEVKVMMRV